MKGLERYLWGFVVIALAILLLLEKCNNGKNCPDIGIVAVKTEVRTDTIKGKSEIKYIPVPYAVTVHDTIESINPNPIKEIVPYYVTVPQETARISPVTTSYYRDTLKFDSSGYAIVKDTVRGSIAGRGFEYLIFKPTITNTLTVDNKKLKLYLGLEYIYPANYFGGAALIQFKNNNILRVAYGFANKKSQYSLGYYPKIKLK